jgi:hypothetical protein
MAYFNKNISYEYNYYDLTGSQVLSSAYSEAVAQPWFVQGAYNSGASVYFEKADSVITTDGNLTLGAYPHLYGADWINVDYYLDGQFCHSTRTAPYQVSLTGIKGTHTLHAVATGSNGAVMERDYTIQSEFKAESAEDFSDVSQLSEEQKSAVDYVVKNGIITGYDDGTLKPSNTITRAEFAAMVCRMMGYLADAPCVFDDAATHWGSRYIGACVTAGAINGIGGNCFAPDSSITFEQAVKIVSVVTGTADADSDYPNGFISAAESAGTLAYMTSTQIAVPLSRIDAAVLISNSVR